jgi:hypothetical protein
LVGRSTLADLRLESRRGSNEHASLGWHSGRWILRDLGSSNGTTVDGCAVSPRERVVLSAGNELRFGGDDEVWTLTELGAPEPCAIWVGPQQCRWGERSLLVLPSLDAPEASIFVAGDQWQIDTGSELIKPECGDLLPLKSGWWRLMLPELPSAPDALTAGIMLDLALLELTFHVNPERVMLRLIQGSTEVRVPSRAALHTLLALARLRMESQFCDADAGWVSAGELAEMRGSSQERINVDVHRLRKLFQEVGVHDGARVIERDANKRLRIGVRRLREVAD